MEDTVLNMDENKEKDMKVPDPIILLAQDSIYKTKDNLYEKLETLKEARKALQTIENSVDDTERNLVEMADFLNAYSSETLRAGEDWLASVLRDNEEEAGNMRDRYDDETWRRASIEGIEGLQDD